MELFSRNLMGYLSLFACVTAARELSRDRKPTIDFTAGNDSYLLATKSAPINLILDAADWAGVLRAAHDVAIDFGRITGVNGSLTAVGKGTANASAIFNVTGIASDWVIGSNSSAAGTYTGISVQKGSGTIVAGTIGNSSFIDALIKSGKLDVSGIEGKWEAYVSTIVKNPANGTDEALVIAGKVYLVSEDYKQLMQFRQRQTRHHLRSIRHL
jgi:hypothetical protein